jgi:hypothetical protein
MQTNTLAGHSAAFNDQSTHAKPGATRAHTRFKGVLVRLSPQGARHLGDQVSMRVGTRLQAAGPVTFGVHEGVMPAAAANCGNEAALSASDGRLCKHASRSRRDTRPCI